MRSPQMNVNVNVNTKCCYSILFDLDWCIIFVVVVVAAQFIRKFEECRYHQYYSDNANALHGRDKERMANITPILGNHPFMNT